jgi:hypothetical protein
VDDYVDFGAKDHFGTMDQMTIAAWIKLRSYLKDYHRGIISKFREPYPWPSGSWYFSVATFEGRSALYFDTTTTGGRRACFGATNLTLGEWHHVVGVYDGARLSVYLDGQLDGSIDHWGGTLGANTIQLTVGRLLDLYFDGVIDEAQIYNRALTAEEVEEIYRGGRALLDYQLAVELDPTNFDYSRAAPDGSDLRFTLGDGVTELPHWIESWNPGGESRVWVRAPSVPPGESTIFMYCGNLVNERKCFVGGGVEAARGGTPILR